MMTFDWLHIIATSPTMLCLLACSVLTTGVVIERLHYYWKRRGNPEETLAAAMTRVRAGEIKEAAWTCRNAGHPMGVVAAAVLEQQRGLAASEVEEKMLVALSEQKLLLERNMGFLGTMAGAAPLIGLLGTVWGIMRAFHDMALSGSSSPSVVAAGIAEALITTATGLVVAVPALVLHNHFARQMNVMLTVAENHTRTLRAAAGETTPARPETATRRPTPVGAGA